MERMRGRGGLYGGGCFSYFGAANRTIKKITKIKYNKGLRWPPSNILHATTDQKQAGMTEEGWDKPRDRARMLRECDDNEEPLAEGNNNDDDEYNKDSNIPKDEDKYAVGLTVSTSPLLRATISMKLSALPPREHALRVSG